MINTLTLNPGIDHILCLDKVERNITNRIKSSSVCLGGKGTHVSINLSMMGTMSRAFGLSYGHNGKQIQDMLSDSGITVCFIHSENGESRDNYVVVEEDTRDCTLMAHKGPQVETANLDALFQLLDHEIKPGDDLVLSGDVSNLSDSDIYSRILDLLSGKKLQVSLDASGQSLSSAVLRKPFLIKPNLDELSALVDKKIVTRKDIIGAILTLDKLGIEVIAVSLGSNGSVVRAEDSLYHAAPPKVQVINTVGCGDCYLAGLLHSFSNGFDIQTAIRYATAVSGAKAEEMQSVGFDLRRAQELLEQVTMTKL